MECVRSSLLDVVFKQSLLPSMQDYKDDIDSEGAVQLALKVLSKTMDSTTLSHEKLELAKVSRTKTGEVVIKVYQPDELDKLVKLHKIVLEKPADT
jgi:20S proteasome subunit alpha 3